MEETDPRLGQRLEKAIMSLLDRRADTASICPSEVAREVYDGHDDGWRALMAPARRAAWRLADHGKVEVTQGGQTVTETQTRGPIRIRRTHR